MKLPKQYATNVKAAKIDLTLSINPLGCSPRVLEAMKKIRTDDISSYPKTEKLILKIAKTFKSKGENLILGNGSEQLIKLISQVFLSTGDTVLVERGSFGLFTKEPQLTGAKVKFFDFNKPLNLTNTKLCFIANPKTPTGEITKQDEITKLADKIRPGILVVDEANGEFLKKSSVSLLKRSENIIVLRTFSKVFGLAGLRIGFALGPANLITLLSNAQQTFPVSQISITAAFTAINDKVFIKTTRAFIDSEREFLKQELLNRNLTVSNSVTNNLFVSTRVAKKLIKQLRELDVAVIDGSFFPGMSRPGFRISLKDRKTNQLFLQKLDIVLKNLTVML